MNAITTTEPIGSNGLVPHNLDEALRLAEFMARARTVPKHLQGSPGDCLMVIEQAMRWGMSPFAVAQATSVISGKMMYEGKLVAAAVETSGAIVGQIDYEYFGENADRSIKVSATRRGETNPRSLTVALKDAKTDNVMWTRQPDQQLAYHGVRVWARRWTPAVILGVYSREEMGPVIEGQVVSDEPVAKPEPDPREAINQAVPMPATPGSLQAPPPGNSRDPWDLWLETLDNEAAKLSDTAGWDEFWQTNAVKRAFGGLQGERLARLEAIQQRHRDRLFPEPPTDEAA